MSDLMSSDEIEYARKRLLRSSDILISEFKFLSGMASDSQQNFLRVTQYFEQKTFNFIDVLIADDTEVVQREVSGLIEVLNAYEEIMADSKIPREIKGMIQSVLAFFVNMLSINRFFQVIFFERRNEVGRNCDLRNMFVDYFIGEEVSESLAKGEDDKFEEHFKSACKKYGEDSLIDDEIFKQDYSEATPIEIKEGIARIVDAMIPPHKLTCVEEKIDD